MKVEQVSLGDAVLNQFLEMIRSGVYKVGDKLPSERDLCQKLDVSRSVLREVLSVLRHLGYIETIQGGGNYISNHPLAPSVSTLRLNVEAEQMRTLEVWETRNILETEMAALAAQRAGEIEIKNICQKYEEYKKLVQDHMSQDAINRASARFHEAISAAAHNDTLNYLLKAVANMLSESRNKTGRIEGSNERSVKEHGEITQAIAARDEKEARCAMARHLQSVKADLERFLQSAEKSSEEK